MTHEQIRKKIKELEGMLEQPEVVKEKAYRSILIDKKKVIFSRYLPSNKKYAYWTPINNMASDLFDKALENSGREVFKGERTSIYEENLTAWFIKNRLVNIQNNEELYLKIFESLCKGIANAISDLENDMTF